MKDCNQDFCVRCTFLMSWNVHFCVVLQASQLEIILHPNHDIELAHFPVVTPDSDPLIPATIRKIHEFVELSNDVCIEWEVCHHSYTVRRGSPRSTNNNKLN